MNLLSLIIIFLALIVCGAVGYIAWELTSEQPSRSGNNRQAKDAPGSAANDSSSSGKEDPPA